MRNPRIQESEMKKTIVIAVIAGAFALAGSLAYAQMHDSSEGHGMKRGQMMGMMHGAGKMHGGMQDHGNASGSHGGTASAQGDQGPSSLAFKGVNAKMHQGMNITFSGNADRDFIQAMIPHHEGAVDMAKIVVAFGKDPEVRKLAESIIKAQEEEIALMKSWQQKTANK
jgi:uncharacterized protein (DUF305 family)